MASNTEPATKNESRVCLDFGTAFSKASVYLSGDSPAREAVRPLAIGAISGADHPLLTPSVMFVDRGRILFGPAALECARRDAGSDRDPMLSFKVILAARDLDPALQLKVKPSVDPTGTLRHRDALVLYLAHLDQLIGAAIRADAELPDALAQAARRYTSPIWRTRGEADRTMARLFDEAAIVSARLGDMLTHPDGASIAQCKDALDKGEQALGMGQLEAGVFEAHAAAAAYGAFTRTPRQFMLVLDVGAGTTDIAGFERIEQSPDPVLAEIVGARHSCGLAGDEIDQIIANLITDKSKLRQRADQARLWRTLQLSARGLKRDLFKNGKCVFVHAGKSLTLRQTELYSAARFKQFNRALASICAASLGAVVARAKEKGAGAVTILLAGGGANLPFVSAIAASAAAQAGQGLTIDVEAFGADWYLPSGFDPNLRAAFPQVAISLGGALAHLSDEPALAPA
jgi:molecular chaperone DnaK (HSP70)